MGDFTTCEGNPADGTTPDCVVTNLLDSYTIQSAVNGDNQANYAVAGINVNGNGVRIGNTADGSDSALSLLDFNIFRKRVAVALNKLDEKFEALLKVALPNCQ